MPHSTDRILTTHVGSLIRPPKLIEFWRSIEDGKPYDETAFEACLTESVAEVVRQQAEAGIDIVSDGEFSKGANWAFYVHKRLSGIAVRPATPEEAKDPMASMGGGRDHQGARGCGHAPHLCQAEGVRHPDVQRADGVLATVIGLDGVAQPA